MRNSYCLFLVTFLLLFFSSFTYGGDTLFVAMLKPGIDSLLLGTKTNRYSIHANQKFNACCIQNGKARYWLQTGQWGTIESSKIEIDKKSAPLKLKPQIDKRGLKEINWEGNEAFESAKRQGYDYPTLLTKALEHDFAALKTMFTIGMDGGAGDLHMPWLWKIINDWPDTLFAQFFTEQDISTKMLIAGWLWSPFLTYPISDFDRYYKAHYSETYGKITEFQSSLGK